MAQDEARNENRLLAALTDADWQRWRTQLEWVYLTRGQALCEPGHPLRYAYFPTSAIVSLTSVLASGASTGIAVVGFEGVVGTPVLLGTGSTTNGSTVLIAGQGVRIGARAIRDEFCRSDTAREVLLHYVQALWTQAVQTTVCTSHHSIEQRLCSLLLHLLDRLRGDEVVVTQDLIAGMLGVRRESVTVVAGHLKEAGLIHYFRGHIAVHSRVGLEQRSCECHAVVKKEYDRLFSRLPIARPAVLARRTSPAYEEAA